MSFVTARSFEIELTEVTNTGVTYVLRGNGYSHAFSIGLDLRMPTYTHLKILQLPASNLTNPKPVN